MNIKIIFYSLGSFVIGSLVTFLFMNNMTKAVEHSMSMNDMVNSLDGKSGDEFDKAFIVSMIEHHQGAVDMAKEAKENAKHQEIKIMSDAIIKTQSEEIKQMKQWQKEWGYTHNH